MYSNKKIRNFVFGFLALAVLTSKNIFIYNEETLVAASFLGFILFVFYYFGNTISSSLDERRDAIKSEYVQFLNSLQESLAELSNEHKKGSKMDTALLALTDFTVSVPLYVEGGKSGLLPLFSQQMIEKLNTLYGYKSGLQNKLLHIMSGNSILPVLVEMKKINNR